MHRLIFCLLAFSFFSISLSFGQETCKHCPDFMNFDASSMEDALAKPLEIKSMDIAMQKLSTIDSRIGTLEKLECLDLSFNRFSSLPPEFGQLKNLKCLILTGTRFLSSVPAVLTELPNLEYLDISDHPEWSEKQFKAAEEMLPGVKVVY